MARGRRMERRWWGGWKVKLAAGLVSVGLVATVLGIALVPRIRSPLATRASSPLATLAVSPSGAPAAQNLVVPAGWKQALPGLVVSDFGHFNTLVTSAAKPSRVAAYGLPPHPWPVMVAPQ